MRKITLFIAFILLCGSFAVAQDDLLSLLEEEETTVLTNAVFKTTRVINSHSIENVAPGVLDFKISHRFGFLNSGIGELFGLDNATMRIGFDYGLSKKMMIGIGRSSFEKTIDGFFKYKIIRQSTGKKSIPMSVSWTSSIEVVTIDFPNETQENFNSSRYFYSHQLILARKFSDGFSFQLMPTLVHRNLVEKPEISNDVVSIGAGFRQKISKRFTINAEYFYNLPDQLNSDFKNSLSIGFDIETGGHVFQVHLSNSTSMIYKGFIAETRGDFFDGDIHFGFNIARVFTLKKPNNIE